MAKYFFCNKFVNEMFLGCNITKVSQVKIHKRDLT